MSAALPSREELKLLMAASYAKIEIREIFDEQNSSSQSIKQARQILGGRRDASTSTSVDRENEHPNSLSIVYSHAYELPSSISST